MTLYTSDEQESVDVGSGSVWFSIYSTALILFSDELKEKIPLAMAFLKTGVCSSETAKETEAQLQTVQRVFSSIAPDRAVYDYRKPDVLPPWAGSIASSVTSCANLYTTSDGEDLFTEVLALLSYARQHNVSVCAG